MYRCVETVIEYLECKNHFTNKNKSIDEIFENDKMARALSQKYLKDKSL